MSRQEAHAPAGSRWSPTRPATCARSRPRQVRDSSGAAARDGRAESSYLDRVDFDAGRASTSSSREAGQAAQSSQPSVGEFVSVYKAAARTTTTRWCRCTSRAVFPARCRPRPWRRRAVDPARVRVVDSRQVSVGVGLVVQAAGEAIRPAGPGRGGGGGRSRRPGDPGVRRAAVARGGGQRRPRERPGRPAGRTPSS